MVLLHDPVDLDGDESDGDDSISLCDLPTGILAADCFDAMSDGRDLPAGSFEFFAAARPEMCAADDVIVAGKLLPFVAPPPPMPEIRKTHGSDFPETARRRSNSWGRCWGGKLTGEEYQKLKRVSTDPDSGSGSKVATDPRKQRPRWYVMAFGSVRIPAGMEISEIRARQRRRSASSPVAREAGEWVPWKLLQSLSCNGLEAVVVA